MKKKGEIGTGYPVAQLHVTYIMMMMMMMMSAFLYFCYSHPTRKLHLFFAPSCCQTWPVRLCHIFPNYFVKAGPSATNLLNIKVII